MSTGVVLPYLNLYFKKIGLNGKQIGTLTSVGMFCMFLAPPLWSVINDRYNKHGRLIGMLIVACAASFFALSFANIFYYLIPVVFLFYFFYAPLIPLSDATTLEYVNHTENDSFGRVRMWGTVGFVIASVVFGWLINTGASGGVNPGADGGSVVAVGMRPIFYGFILVMAGALFFSRLLPKEHVRSKRPDFRNIRLLVNSNLILFFFISFAFGAASTASLQFLSIYLDSIGAGGGLIGYSWAFAAVFEIVILRYNKNLVDLMGVKWLIVTGMIAACLRWFLCSITYNPYLALPIQMLHSVTFAAFHIGAITFVFKESPSQFRSTAQFAYRSVSGGLGPIVGMLFGGYMLDAVGIFTLYRITSAVIFLTVLLVVVFIREPVEPATEER